MNLHTFFIRRTIVFTVLIVIGLLYAGFQSFNAYIYNQKQGDGSVGRYRGTLTGVYICMQSNTPDNATSTCEPGLQTSNDELYAFNVAAVSQPVPVLEQGNTVRATGVITPIELLSTNYWQQYNVVGIFSATSDVQIISAQ